MNQIKRYPLERLGYGFIDTEFIPEGKDEYYLRTAPDENGTAYRNLNAHEIEVLVKNDNRSDDWNRILVTDSFRPELVKNCRFYGLVRIGDLEPEYLEYHDLRVPVGLYNSTIISSDIGSNVAIDNVRYLSHYRIGNEAILLNINEMSMSNHAKFGNGIVTNGEDESVRIWLEVGNENGGRKILPFDGMITADAYLWAKFRGEPELMRALVRLTEKRITAERGRYGTIGERTIIKHCGILKDVKIGTDAYIKGANKLKNLTINSSAEESTQIGEGVELVNGIVGYGCKIFYGSKAVRFIMGTNSVLKYGARLINSILGDNSTISCCEVLNSLIFPGHEQHHNNSFLCASIVLGQSNIAAGATIGSNHNSRGSDGEIVAGRGFWPGLCTSLKHNSKFASYCLIVKGQYPAELRIPLPFTMVSNNEHEGGLSLMPGYWFMYNMYALARNSWKYGVRDKRVKKEQLLEFEYLAPDTVEELFEGLSILEDWTARAVAGAEVSGQDDAAAHDAALKKARALLASGEADRLEIPALGVERSARSARVVKAGSGYRWFKRMIVYYGVKNLVANLSRFSSAGELFAAIAAAKREPWTNVGGQLIRNGALGKIKQDLVSGTIGSWDELHRAYHSIDYASDKLEHALASLRDILGGSVDAEALAGAVAEAESVQRDIARLTYESRKKDYENEFRRMTYDTQAEMDAVLGTIADDSFIGTINAKTEEFLSGTRELSKKFLSPSHSAV
jgi:hypothetical protein